MTHLLVPGRPDVLRQPAERWGQPDACVAPHSIDGAECVLRRHHPAAERRGPPLAPLLSLTVLITCHDSIWALLCSHTRSRIFCNQGMLLLRSLLCMCLQ